MGWTTPITDRSLEDVVFARNNQGNFAENKGALNYSDLNRIEDNFYYLVDKLREKNIIVNYTKRNFTEITYEFKEYEIEPEEYTLVPYIEGTGTQYIDTGITTTSNTTVFMDFRLTKPYSYDGNLEHRDIYILGDGNQFGLYWIKSSNFWWFVPKNSNGIFQDKDFPGSDLHSLTMSKSSVSLGNYGFRVNERTSFGKLFLFSDNLNGAGAGISEMQLYKCKIYNSNELVRDYIPVIDSNGTPCLYDKVSKTFFYNRGTGSFTVPYIPPADNEENKIYYEESVKTVNTYTRWYENNIPYISEINRIRGNINNLVMQFPFGIELPTFEPSSNLLYDEVNKWENVELEIRNALLRTEISYRFCGTFDCGGDFI